VAGDVGLGVVERLVLEEAFQLRLRLAAQARFLLLHPLGLDPFFLLALRAGGGGLGPVDVLLAALGPGLARALRRARLAALPRFRRRALARRLVGVAARIGPPFGLALGLGGRLEAQAQQLVAE